MEQSGSVRSGDAEISYFVEPGPAADSPTILLIMGLGASSVDWGTLPGLLAVRHRVVALDNRGTGRSAPAAGSFSLETMAGDAIAVLDAVGARTAHVLGLSMGGMIAQLVALDHRERVEKLVLMSTHCGGPDVTPPFAEIAPVLFPPRGMAPAEIIRTRIAAICAPGWAETNASEVERHVRDALELPTPMRTYRAQLEAIMQGDRRARLGNITAPTLVIHGDVDPLVPYPNGQVLAAQIPGARLVTLPGVGHMPIWETPEETARSVLEFLG